eukprot:s329_g8.t1
MQTASLTTPVLQKKSLLDFGSWLCLLGRLFKVLPDTKHFVQSRHYFKPLHHRTTVPSFQLLDSHGNCRWTKRSEEGQRPSSKACATTTSCQCQHVSFNLVLPHCTQPLLKV